MASASNTIELEIIAAGDKVSAALSQVASALGKVKSATGRTSKATNNLGKSANKASGAFGNLASAFKRIVIYRGIRSIIAGIGEAFQTGLTNAYQYSKLIGGDLANALDTMSTKTLTMKNQLGAAWATLLMQLQPIILTIINLVTKVASVLTQFFAILGGKNFYMKATDTANEWAEAASAGAASAEEWKNQLMGFDEINRLDDQSDSGGGGGSSTPDYGSMFEKTELDSWAEKLKEHLGLIKALAWGIGAALASWLIISPLLKNMAVLGDKFKTLCGLVMAIAGAAIMAYSFLDMWNNGVDWEGLITFFGGFALLVGGLALAFGTVGAAIGFIVGGIAAVVLGFKEWITTGEATNETLTLISVGIIAIGAGIALLTGSWIPLAIAAVAAGVAWVVGKWDTISAWFAKIWDSVSTWFSTAWDNIKNWFTTAWNDIGTWFNNIVTMVGNVIDKIKDKFNNLKERISEIKNNIVEGFQNAIEKVKGFFTNFQLPHIKVPHITVTWEATGSLLSFFGINQLPHFSIECYANGGFPTAGQLFIANEAGAEMVGSMGGHTAVANNQEIVEGIKQGVLEAMLTANGNGKQSVNVYLDGKQLADSVSKWQRTTARAMGV